MGKNGATHLKSLPNSILKKEPLSCLLSGIFLGNILNFYKGSIKSREIVGNRTSFFEMQNAAKRDKCQFCR